MCVSMKKLYVSVQALIFCPCYIFDTDTRDKMVLMKVNQPFQTCNDLIVRQSKASKIKTQHPWNDLSEVCQLQEQTEKNTLITKNRKHGKTHTYVHAYIQTQAFVLVVQSIEISAVHQCRELKRMKNGPLGDTSNNERRAEVLKISKKSKQFQVFFSILHRHIFPVH